MYADPYNSQDIAEKIISLIENEALRSEIIKKGLECYKKYSWDKTARETLQVYEKLLEKV